MQEPKFTYYTIIGKDTSLFRGHIENIKSYAGFDKISGPKELLAIVYRNSSIPEAVTRSILDFCDSSGVRAVIYDEPTDVFLENLYACWNLGYEKADDGIVFRGGSDQVFSRDSMLKMADLARKNYHQDVVLQANTIENAARIREIGANSRHFISELGSTFDDFDYKGFECFIDSLPKSSKDLLTIQEALGLWKKPTSFDSSLGRINRTDGCSWTMRRRDWEKYGPIPTVYKNITGDVAIHDFLQKAGFKSYIAAPCTTYHFVRGESMSKQG